MDPRQTELELKNFLTDDIAVREMPQWLEVRSLSRLARTCTATSKLFQNTLLIERLAHFLIVSPSVLEVIKMVRACPELLNTNIPKVINRKDQVIRNNKPFSLAFGAGDDEMCAALKQKMIIFYGGKEAAEAEIKNQLCEKIGEEDKEQDDGIRNQLDALLRAVIQAITNEQFNLGRDADNKLILNPATLATIETFREGLAELQSRTINKGMHFRLSTLQESYDAYVQAAAQWGYDHNRCALFEDGALSSVLFNVPENDGMRFSQGLYFLQKDQPEDFARCLTLRGTKHDFYDYLRSGSVDFSNLSGSCVDIYAGARCAAGRGAGVGRPRVGLRFLSKLMSSKNFKLTELMQPMRAQTHSIGHKIL